MKQNFDVVVIGGGHAGIEASWIISKLGYNVAMVTMDTKAIGRMSCNPAIGGTAKGHLVKEIDVLGGLMGRLADETGIQFKVLNKSKGPAVWSPRCQSDREFYSTAAVTHIKSCDKIEIIEGSVEEILVTDRKVRGVLTTIGVIYAKCIIITTGTFLSAVMHTGKLTSEGGRVGEKSAKSLSKSLLKLGFKLGRLKTGTPPRLSAVSVDFSACEEQPGDPDPQPFSMYSNGNFPKLRQISCYLTYTNELTHDILREGFSESPMFTGRIKGTGPRYCPSIEDKIYRFADKKRHQLFLEPEGLESDLIYLNGFSSSLPAEIQEKALRTIPGLEKAIMVRPGYAVEYDFLPTYQTNFNLETKLVEGLFVAGQINGTSGYEEAAAQGIIAGINAVMKLNGEEPFMLKRSDAYIGVLIDDLINKIPDEPYRIFTSSAEYRLILRQDNADLRLAEHARKLGTIPNDTYNEIIRKKNLTRDGLKYLRSTYISPKDINEFLRKSHSSEIIQSESLAQLIKRNEVSLYNMLKENYFSGNKLAEELLSCPGAINQIEIEMRYEGYIQRQIEQIKNFEKEENIQIPDDFDYNKIKSLSSEAKEKLTKIKPRSLGQASRIAGVSPVDISILHVYMKG